VIAYLDTNVVLFLVRRKIENITRRAQQALERHDLLVSPIVMLELDYLYEIRQSAETAEAILGKLYDSIDLRQCSLPFDRIVRAASTESWTRDVFDRLVVAHAKANDRAPLISSDEVIASHYPNVIW
jgi:PIN domain nuclease of toxin-antitoxin system